MANKATSCYLTVSDKKTHKSVLHKMFFNMGQLNEFIKTEEFKEKYPSDVYYITKETY